MHRTKRKFAETPNPTDWMSQYVVLVEQAIASYETEIQSASATVKESYLTSLALSKDLLSESLRRIELFKALTRVEKQRGLSPKERSEIMSPLTGERIHNAEKIRSLRMHLIEQQNYRKAIRNPQH